MRTFHGLIITFIMAECAECKRIISIAGFFGLSSLENSPRGSRLEPSSIGWIFTLRWRVFTILRKLTLRSKDYPSKILKNGPNESALINNGLVKFKIAYSVVLLYYRTCSSSFWKSSSDSNRISERFSQEDSSSRVAIRTSRPLNNLG